MSVVVGSYTLPNPTRARRSIIAPGESWTMADGSEAAHYLTVRYAWEYEWLVSGTDLSNLRAAIEVAITSSVSFKPWDSSTYYTVRADASTYDETPVTTTYYRITCEFREVTA